MLYHSLYILCLYQRSPIVIYDADTAQWIGQTDHSRSTLQPERASWPESDQKLRKVDSAVDSIANVWKSIAKEM